MSTTAVPTFARGLSRNALGSLYMAVGSLGYVVNDALIRSASDAGLDVYQALFFRSFGLTVLFAAASGFRRESISRTQLSGPLVVRVIAELLGVAFFFAALVNMEFANAQTILLLVPFAVTLAAALFLGESVTRLQYAIVVMGFLGVLLVVQPATDGFSYWSIPVLLSAASLVARELATQRVPSNVPTGSIALLTSCMLTVLVGAISAFTGWGPMTLENMALVGLACLSLVAGYVFTIKTVRVGDLSVSAPFRYTTLLGAVVLGYLFFDEVPNGLTLLGCAVILVSGVYAIRLERQAAPQDTNISSLEPCQD